MFDYGRGRLCVQESYIKCCILAMLNLKCLLRHTGGQVESWIHVFGGLGVTSVLMTLKKKKSQGID